MDILPKQFYLETRVLLYSLWSILIFIQYVSYLFLMVYQKNICVAHLEKKSFLIDFLKSDFYCWQRPAFLNEGVIYDELAH